MRFLKKMNLNIKRIFILALIYLSYFMFIFNTICEVVVRKMLYMDIFLKFAIATLILVILNILIAEIFKETAEFENNIEYERYYNSVTNSYNLAFKAIKEIIHEKLTKEEYKYNVAVLKKQREYLDDVNIPKKYLKSHNEIIIYIDEILESIEKIE
ncbi:hypothetical protein BFS06_11870 [Clostridium perfringens]|uniref:Uncharacterized protein n=2 Tax=Clostridium perfringens TaxID=1502 RepID=A0A140GS77_CLOPF|nr:hypothetical protein [Clostridium perfringens]AMN31386.1 hypothetical protein JFP838_pA0470 [Clostridium perfringens]TBX14900.1 hypothetical protein BFS06_11870 [Clostridium perfringens]